MSENFGNESVRTELTQPIMIDPVRLTDNYLAQNDWRVHENSNVSFNVGGYTLFEAGAVTSAYWLDKLYPKEVADAHRQCFIHIHDLSWLGPYCAGWSLGDLIKEGLGGVRDKISSAPAKHLITICQQMVNFMGIMQNEWAGAQAFSSFDTYLAPFIKVDNLSDRDVRQALQAFVYGINTPSRWGSQPPFSNITMDLVVPKDMADKNPYIGGKKVKFTYADCQEEISRIDRIFFQLIEDGDSVGNSFQYPIITVNIDKDFKWDSEVTELLFKMAAKTGNPYFSNYVSTGMSSGDVRSMCCRLRLDLRELRRSSSGGLGGSAEKTGSVGVVTLNLPRMAYLSKGDKNLFFSTIDHYMDIASESLEIKRKMCDKLMEGGFFPYSQRYLGTFNNHFSTIGLVGMNEACRNFFADHSDISTKIGKALAEEVLNHMRNRLSTYQVSTGHLYNLESTPAESTAYRFAKHDVEDYPDILTAGKRPADVYYTNSSNLPVDYTSDVWKAIRHQEKLQKLYTGGTVFHTYRGESVDDWTKARDFVRSVMENSELPYVTISPVYSMCPIHGFIKGKHSVCPKCKEEQIEKYQEALEKVQAEIKATTEEIQHDNLVKE